MGTLHSTSMIAMEGCSKCVSGGSPFRSAGNSNAAEFSVAESLEDSRSISSGLFERVSGKKRPMTR